MEVIKIATWTEIISFCLGDDAKPDGFRLTHQRTEKVFDFKSVSPLLPGRYTVEWWMEGWDCDPEYSHEYALLDFDITLKPGGEILDHADDYIQPMMKVIERQILELHGKGMDEQAVLLALLKKYGDSI